VFVLIYGLILLIAVNFMACHATSTTGRTFGYYFSPDSITFLIGMYGNSWIIKTTWLWLTICGLYWSLSY